MRDRTERTQVAVAKEIGITRYHLNAVLKGRVIPSVPLALKIEEITKGKYKAVDLRPELKALTRKNK